MQRRPSPCQLPRRLQNADFVVFAYRRLDEKISQLGDLLLVVSAGLNSLPVSLGLPHRHRDPDPRLGVRQQHRSPETRLPPGGRHDRVPVDADHLLRVHRTDPKVHNPSVHDPTPSQVSQYPDTLVSSALYNSGQHFSISAFQLVSTLPSAACQHFSLLPFGSCPVTFCETSFRQELCRVLRSDEPRHPADKSPKATC